MQQIVVFVVNVKKRNKVSQEEKKTLRWESDPGYLCRIETHATDQGLLGINAWDITWDTVKFR